MDEPKDFDGFWMGKGQKMVNESFTHLNTSLSNYGKYLNYLTGFYLIGSITAETLLEVTDLWIFIALALPLAITALAMLMLSVGPKVQTEALDLRSPLSINAAHNALVTGLKEDVKHAKVWVVAATAAVLLGGSMGVYMLNIAKSENAKSDSATSKNERSKKVEEILFKEAQKNLKFKVDRNLTKNTATVEAKFLEDRKLLVTYVLVGETSKRTDTFTVPKYQDFKVVFDSVQKIDIEEITIKTQKEGNQNK